MPNNIFNQDVNAFRKGISKHIISEKTGVALYTVKRFFDGEAIQVHSMVKILDFLGCHLKIEPNEKADGTT